MKFIWALRLLLLYLVQSVVCRYNTYDTKSRPTFNIGEENEMSFHSPNAWYHQYNGYPWWRVHFPSSWAIPHSSFPDKSHQQSHHFSSPFLTKLGYYYIGPEYNLPNFVIRPIAFGPDLHGPSCLDEADQLTSTGNPKVPLRADHADKNSLYESSTISANVEEYDKQDIINELPHVQGVPDNSYIAANIATEMPYFAENSFHSSTGENIPYLSQIFDEEINSNLPTSSNNFIKDPPKESLNENSSHNLGEIHEINASHFSHVITEQSSDFSGTTTEGSKTQETTGNSFPDNSHISLNLETVNYINKLVDNAVHEESNSEVEADESAMASSKPSTFSPLNTSEYSSDMTITTNPTEVQLLELVDLTENVGNASHSVPVFNSPNSEDRSTPKHPDHIFHLNITEKLNKKELKGIANVTTEISASEYSATSKIDLPNEIVESNTIAAILNSFDLLNNSTLTSETPSGETNMLEGSMLITHQILNANKIEEEPNGKVPTNEDTNSFSENFATSFPPVENTTVENLVTPKTQEYWNVESVETTTAATHISIHPTELSTLIRPSDSEAGGNVFIQEGVVQLSNFDSTTNVHAQDHLSESPLSTLDSFSEPSTTEILSDLSTMYVGGISLSEPNDISFMDGMTVSSSESLNVSNFAEDATVLQNPEQVVNHSLNVTSSSEETNTKETLILNSNVLHYSQTANGSAETSTEKLALEHSNFDIEEVEQNDKVNETENVISTPHSLLTSSSSSEEESISEHLAPTTHHTINASEATGSNEQETASESPLYGSTTNFPLEITDSENWVNLTTEISSDFNPTQELSNKVNENGNLNVTMPALVTNSDNTNIYFPTNDEIEIATASSVIKTQNSLNDNPESENDSIIFPYNEVLQEEDISDNYHHNISFLETNANREPLHYLGNYENVSSINIHSYTEDPHNEDSSNVPDAYTNDVVDIEKNINEDRVDSLEIQHPSINNIGRVEGNSNEFTENRQEEKIENTKPQDDYTISPNGDIIATMSENKFPSTNDPELTILPGDTIAMSNQQDNSFNKNEDNPDRSYSFTTLPYSDFENGNLHIPQFSENFSNEDDKNNYPVVPSISLSYEKVKEDIGSLLSTMRPETKYEFSQNDNKHEVVNSLTEESTPAYSATETENSLSLLRGDEMHTTENIINEKSRENIYKGEESNSQNHTQGISETKENIDTDQVIDEEYSFHENLENPSEVIFTSDVPPDHNYETEPNSYSFGGSLTEFGDDFSDSFYGLKFPEVTEPSHSLKKYLPPAQDNIDKITSAANDSDDQSSYFQENSENSNAQEKMNDIPSDTQKYLTDSYSFKEYPEILDEDVYYDSEDDDIYEDPSVPQENKELYGSNSLPNSLKNIPQNTVGGFHRSDIPIEDEISHDDPISERLLQRRKRRDATLSHASTQKPETKHKLPSGDFSVIPDESAKSENEKVTFLREKRTFGKIPLLSMFYKRPELGFYKGKLIKNVIVRPLLQKKLDFLHKKLFLTSLLAGFLGTHDSGHFKRSVHVKPTPATHPCNPCHPHAKSIHSSESRESGGDHDYYYSDDEYYFDEKNLESAERSSEVEATPVHDDSDASITDFISMLPSFEGHQSD